MAKRRSKRRQAIIRRRIFLGVTLSVIAVLLTAIIIMTSSVIRVLSKNDSDNTDSSLKSEPASESQTEPYIVSSAKVINTGDIILHSPILTGAYNANSDSYDFSSFFKATKKYFSDADLAVANLEVTLGGKERGYRGYPVFNSPDSLIDTIEDAGINFLLTSNNHCYDTGLSGLKRTVSVLKEKKIDYIGTRENANEAKYTVKNVNGIKLGITNFTFENTCEAGRKSINGNLIALDANPLINSFNYDRISEFYTEAESIISAMKKEGAEAIIFYMHWGEEYKLIQNRHQDAISQRLCNLGVDVIVGGHPHVIQPIKLLHSEDSQNTSVCIYSLGNAISNQRREAIPSLCSTGHTEDGMLFYYTFDKYSDGRVALSSIDVIPTWVDKYSGGAGYLYTMYPLENEAQIDTLGLNSATLAKAKASYERTKQIVKDGLLECNSSLGKKSRFE